MDEFARHAAHKITLVVGSWQVFLLALLLIAGWALSGPIFGFSDTWQLVINTSTTIVTFLLGILILLEANRQAKESKVVHDELIRAVQGARNQLINIDEMSEADVDRLEADLRRRGERAKPASEAPAPRREASDWLDRRDGSAQLLDADQVARGIAEGAVANPVRLLGRLLDDLGVAGLQPLEGAVEVRWWPG